MNAETSEGSLRVLFRFDSDRVFFRFLSDKVFFRVFLRVLSDRFLFESLGSPSGYSLIASSPGSSVLFFRHAAIFLFKRTTTFWLKTDVLFYIIFTKRASHLTIRNEKSKEILEWYRHEILYWKYISSVSPFMNYLGCWICSNYILHEKLNKILLEPDWPLFHFET